MRNPVERKDPGPGVPEAVPQGLQRLLSRYGASALDRVWIFPPLISGRRESGLLVASVFTEGPDPAGPGVGAPDVAGPDAGVADVAGPDAGAPDPDRRVLVSSPYTAERTGKGLRLEWSLQEQGEAPADRFPRMVEGVVRRAEKDLGEPRELVVEGDEAVVLEALHAYAPELLDPELPPAAVPTEPLTAVTEGP